MDQNSGDGEPNTDGSQQCKLKYAKTEETTSNCGSMSAVALAGDCAAEPSATTTIISTPGSPTTGNKATTVFNVGAEPFVSSTTSTLSSPQPPSFIRESGSRLFPWKSAISTSTPMTGPNVSRANSNNNPHNHPHQQRNTLNGAAGGSPMKKDIIELNNRFNLMVGLGNTPATPQSVTTTNLQPHPMKGKPITTPTMPGNILRHLNNNNIMGSLLLETNPPPMGTGGAVLGPRSAGDYRAYFNGNEQQHLMGMQRTMSSGIGTGGQGNNNTNGHYQYRFDLENNNECNNINRQDGPMGMGLGLPPPGPPPHHMRGNGGCAPVPGNVGLPPNNYGENHFMVTHQNGIIQLKLKDGIEIEMTLDGAIRVVNWNCNVSISLASSSNSAALIHPNGRVLQYHSRVEIMTYDGKNKNNFVRFAKIWYKGISFTSENNALVYLVDSGGTRTTTDTFMDLRNDITEQVFLTGSTHGPAYDNQAKKEVMNHKYWPALDGTEVHELNGFRIAQTVDGMVRITKANKNILVRTSPGNGSATLTTAYIHCTASLGQTSHLFVRRGERRMHFDGAEFVVRNSGHSAGFDSNNLLRVY